ncbi:MAG: VOC family protein [Bacteroidia bacterium]|nr:VOC family protein [Bacteroidia bacterium]
MKNAINWFEIPVKNFEQAKSFYEGVFQAEMQVMEMKEMGAVMAFFPADMQNGVGGSIISGPGYEPSQQGTLVYLNGGEDLSDPLSRVEKSGGKVIVPKTSLGPNGFMAQFIDSEGNRVALHSML